jgi:hypothetical protein
MQKSSQGLTLHADVCMVFSHCFDCCLVESLLHLDSQYCPCSQHYVFLLDLEFEEGGLPFRLLAGKDHTNVSVQGQALGTLLHRNAEENMQVLEV